jgi:hypothetical protein
VALLWTLAALVFIVLGSDALGRRARAHLREVIDAFENPRFSVVPFAELPAWAWRRLAPLQSQFVALGFRELVAYRRNSPRVNWSSILVSDDGCVFVHLWVARRRGLMLWLLLLRGWRVFLRDLLASGRYSLVCLYEGERRFVTSPVEILENASVAGEREYVKTPSGSSFADARRFHDAGAAAFASRGHLVPVVVTTEEEFFGHERLLCAQVAARLRARVGGRGII